MTYNELYLLVLGALSLVSAGAVIFTIDRSGKHCVNVSKRRNTPENHKDTTRS